MLARLNQVQKEIKKAHDDITVAEDSIKAVEEKLKTADGKHVKQLKKDRDYERAKHLALQQQLVALQQQLVELLKEKNRLSDGAAAGLGKESATGAGEVWGEALDAERHRPKGASTSAPAAEHLRGQHASAAPIADAQPPITMAALKEALTAAIKEALPDNLAARRFPVSTVDWNLLEQSWAEYLTEVPTKKKVS